MIAPTVPFPEFTLPAARRHAAEQAWFRWHPAALARAVPLFALWLLLAGPDPVAALVGVAAAAIAARASLALLPPGAGAPNPLALAALFARALRQSVLAGVDIALRALAREPRLSPGIVTVPLATTPGARRDAVRLLASLAPGALPLEQRGDGALPLHVLDIALPHAADLGVTERGFAAAMGAPHG